MAKKVKVNNIVTCPLPSHTVSEIIHSPEFPETQIAAADRIFHLCGTVNLLNIADDAHNLPYVFISGFISLMKSSRDRERVKRLLDRENLVITTEIFNQYFSNAVVDHIMDQYLKLWHKIRSYNRYILILSMSVIPIAKYFSFLDQTILKLNMSVLKYTKNKPNHIYIPISSKFLTNPTQQIKYEMFDRKRIHLSDHGVDVLIRHISQYLNNKQVLQKILAQLKVPKNKTFRH